jgi:hypothetical protein
MNLFTKIIIVVFTIGGFFSCGQQHESKHIEESVYSDLDLLMESCEDLSNTESISAVEEKLTTLIDQYSDSSYSKFSKKTDVITQAIDKAKDLTYVSVIDRKDVFAARRSRHVESFYGLKNDSLKIHFKADKKIKRLLVMEDQSGRVLISRSKASFDFEFDVKYDNPFSIIVEFYEESYFDLSIHRKPSSVENKFARFEIKTDTLIVSKNTKGSIEGKKLKHEKVFNEPKKFVVSKNMSFSGESKVYAPIELPQNTVEFIYTLRISGSTDKLTEDGRLYNQVSSSYKKVRFLGLPLWESEGNGSSITREILNSIFKPKTDNYTLNVFFFDSGKELKKFVNYTGSDYPSAFAYDINNSAISTESRVGLIKKPRSGFSYIGLQTNSTFTDTYAWLDAIALSEVKYYYRLKKTLIRK